MEEIRLITKGKDLLKIGAHAFKDFITPFVKEKAQLSVQKAPTLAQERAWLKAQAKDLDKKQHIFLLLFADGELVGTCNARRKEPQAQSRNVHFGLAISKSHRGQGWGEKLLRRTMTEARKRFKPHRMWLEYEEGNERARRLYAKLGFAEFARQDEYVNHFGRWLDLVMMQYKPKRRKAAKSKPRR